MKVKETIDLVVRGDAASSDEVNALFAEVLEGIKAVVWPEGGKDFAIFPERGAGCSEYRLQAPVEDLLAVPAVARQVV